MKKILIFIFIISMSIGLVSCRNKTYEELYEDYSMYLEEQQTLYDGYINFINEISSTTLKSVVSIEANFLTDGIQNIGSGAVIDEDDLYYYVLTNHHVISYQSSVSNSIYVNNYVNDAIIAEVLFSDASYDLAFLRIAKNIEVTVFDMNINEISSNIDLVVIGYPSNQNHAITMGYFIEYRNVSVDSSNPLINQVNFPVLISSVPVKSGSSGSAIMNHDFELVGLIFAGRFQNGNEISTDSYAIPADKIIEFLELNGYGGLSS